VGAPDSPFEVGRLATGIGGTFTNVVYFDKQTTELQVAKSLTTARDLTLGVVDAIEDAALAVIRTADADMINALKLV
jgi:N-methylhydantoinase A/oxoprolinase/acetone carboxylase beta subunit